MLVYVDTGALYALADAKDPAHGRARAFHAGSSCRYVLTDSVFAETMSLITKRVSKRTAVDFGTALRASPRFRIEEPDQAVREAAWSLFSERADEEWDLIDCLSFALMDSLGIHRAFGFDRHFTQYGFVLVPG